MFSTTKTTNYFKGTYQFQSIFSMLIPGEYQDSCLSSLMNPLKCEQIANSYDYMSNVKETINNDSNNSCDQISKDPVILKTFLNVTNTAGRNCKTLSDIIWKNIFKKNDLYALGVTMFKLEKNMKIKLDNNRKKFIDKLLFGELSDNFYDANTALTYLMKIGSLSAS